MTKTINGVEYTTFEPNKNAKELGIYTSRKFIVVEGDEYFKLGDIIKLKRDDNTSAPWFWLPDESNCWANSWSNLAYYDEPKLTNTIITNIKDEAQHKINKSFINFNNPIMEVHKTSYKHIPAYEFLGAGTPNIVNRFGIIEESEQINQEIFNLCYQIFNTPTEPCVGRGNKIMSIVSNAFKSKENKALEYFNLGTADKLNEDGRREFLDYIYETGDTTKKGFLAKIVEAYKEDKK